MIEYYDVEYVGRVRVGAKLQLDGDHVINDWGEVTALLPGRRVVVYWHVEKISGECDVDEVGSDVFRGDWSEEVYAAMNREKGPAEGANGAA